MKKILTLIVLALLVIQTNTLSQDKEMDDQMLLDDFSDERSALGTSWESFTEQVMGGVSEMNAHIEAEVYLHQRTTPTVFPWSYYAQEFTVSEDWSVVYLPFSDFKAEFMRSNKLNTGKLISLAIVASGLSASRRPNIPY